MKLTEGNEHKEYLTNLENIFSILRHEVGNTVSSLKVTLEVFHENFDHFDDAKKREYLQRGMKIVSRQQAYIDALKSYATHRVNALEKIEFTATWKNFMSMAAEKIKGYPMEIRQHVEMDGCHFMGDMEALNQAMIHVFNNALESMEHSDKPRADLVAIRRHRKAIIVIKDYGVGIEKEHISKIFYPLYTTKPDRMGMGLPLAQKLLGSMGARIEIESTCGKGTEAKIMLPLFSH